MQIEKRIRALSFLAVAALAASCQSSRNQPTVDDSYLINVPEDQRREIIDLRVKRAQLGDEITAAEARLELSKDRREVATQELDVAQQEVDVYQARAVAGQSDPNAQVGENDEPLSQAHAHVDWARAQTDFADMRIELARAQIQLAERRMEVVEAQLELRKAHAVEDLDDDRIPALEINSYRQAVDAAETRVTMAEIEVQAARARAQALVDRMELIAARVPESESVTWRRIVPVREGDGSAREASAPRNDDENELFDDSFDEPFDEQR